MSTTGDNDRAADITLVTDILTFWFGSTEPPRWDSMAHKKDLWFNSTPADDAVVRDRFGDAVERALAGKLDHFIGPLELLKDAPGDAGGVATAMPGKSEVALSLLLDQFPRHLFRGTARAFAGDAHSRDVSYAMLRPERWLRAKDELPVMMQFVLLLPLMHQENLDDNERCLAETRKLYEEAAAAGEEAADVAKAIDFSVSFSGKHCDIIRQYGRYPYRNAAMGRESTPEELEFLKNGPRFGQ